MYSTSSDPAQSLLPSSRSHVMNGVAVRDVAHLDLHRLRLRRRVISLRALAGPVLGPDEAEDVRPQLVGGEHLQAFPAEGSISLFLSYFK